MAETKCQFDLLQRVVVPNGEDVTGAVVTRMESCEAPPMYSLAWTGLNGRSAAATFSESEIRAFNPKVVELPPPPADQPVNVDAKIARTGAKIFKTRHSWRLVKPKRNPSRKSKSKKRK